MGKWDPTVNGTGMRSIRLALLLAVAWLAFAFAPGASRGAVAPPKWVFYAFTDRPAYRPGEKVQWKILARKGDIGGLATPAGWTFHFRLHGPREEDGSKGSFRLDEYGAAWGAFDLAEDAHPGIYELDILDEAGSPLATEVLFRADECERPDLDVTVKAGREGGPGKAYRHGDRVCVNVRAESHSGVPAAGAAVTCVVRARSSTHGMPRDPDLPWREERTPAQDPVRSGGKVLKEETLQADSEGKAQFAFEVPTFQEEGMEFEVEARAMDAFQRGGMGRDSFRVSRAPCYLDARPGRVLVKPGEEVEIKLRAMDSADMPVETHGILHLIRETWVGPGAPPDPGSCAGDSGAGGGRAKMPGFEHREVQAIEASTGPDGRGTARMRPPRKGFYRLAWTVRDGGPAPEVTAGSIWVADGRTRDLGLGPAKLTLILDRPCYRAGETARVLLLSDGGGRRALFTADSGGRVENRNLALTRRALLLEVPIPAGHGPQIAVGAVTLEGPEVQSSRAVARIPSVEHLLSVEIRPSRSTYSPGEEAAFTVRVLDAEGKPAAAEVAFSLTEDAAPSLHEDFAGHPWERFYPSGEAARGPRADSAAADHPAGALAPVSRENVPCVRHDSGATAFWVPDAVTGPDGTVTVRARLPARLTTWRARARAQTKWSDFGEGEASVTAEVPLQVRLNAPPYLAAGDETVVTAAVDNRTGGPVSPSIELTGDGAFIQHSRWAPEGAPAEQQTLAVPPGGEGRLDWHISVRAPGLAKVTATARCDAASHAAEAVIPVFDRDTGMQICSTGRMRGGEARLTVDLPKGWKKGRGPLTMDLRPDLAASLLGALPDLADSSRGCIEQAMSRSMPAAVLAPALKAAAIRPEEGHGQAPEASRTPPQGGMGESGQLDSLESMAADGLARICARRRPDGGWGWRGAEESDPFMTAYVVWGLVLAREAGMEIRGEALADGARFLLARMEREPRPDLQAWMLHAAAAALQGEMKRPDRDGKSKEWPPALEACWSQLGSRRRSLSPSAQALLTLTAVRMGRLKEAKVMAGDLAKSIQASGPSDRSTPDPVAHWSGDRGSTKWLEGPVGATSLGLMALMGADPGSRLLDPIAGWLIQNQRGGHWNSSLETAIAIVALSPFLKRDGARSSQIAVEVKVNGKRFSTARLGGEKVTGEPVRVEVPPTLLRDGPNAVTVRRIQGEGEAVCCALGSYPAPAGPAGIEGKEILVRREYVRSGRAADRSDGPALGRSVLRDGGTVSCGELVQVVLTVEAKRDLEYVRIEDWKPAGFDMVRPARGADLRAQEIEPAVAASRFAKPEKAKKAPARKAANPRSAEEKEYAARSCPMVLEAGDPKVGFYLRDLPRGCWEIRYDLRAETPGSFRALPTVAQSVYMPEIRCTGAETRIGVATRDEILH